MARCHYGSYIPPDRAMEWTEHPDVRKWLLSHQSHRSLEKFRTLRFFRFCYITSKWLVFLAESKGSKPTVHQS